MFYKASESLYKAPSVATAGGTRKQLLGQGLALLVVLQDAQSPGGVHLDNAVGSFVAHLPYVADGRL